MPAHHPNTKGEPCAAEESLTAVPCSISLCTAAVEAQMPDSHETRL